MKMNHSVCKKQFIKHCLLHGAAESKFICTEGIRKEVSLQMNDWGPENSLY